MKTVFSYILSLLKFRWLFGHKKRLEYAEFIFEKMKDNGIQYYKDDYVEVKKEPELPREAVPKRDSMYL